MIVRLEKKITQKRLRKIAAEAVSFAEDHRVAILADKEGSDREQFHSLCGKLAHEEMLVIQARADFLSKLPPEELTDYVPEGSGKWPAAQTVAVMTDFAPEWLYDCATRRRRPIPGDATSKHP